MQCKCLQMHFQSDRKSICGEKIQSGTGTYPDFEKGFHRDKRAEPSLDLPVQSLVF